MFKKKIPNVLGRRFPVPPTKVGGTGNCRNGQERGGGDGARIHTLRHLPTYTVSGPKERRWSKPVINLKKPELICGGTTLENGRDPYSKRPLEKGELASKDESQGCVFFHPYRSKSQETPVCPSGGQTLAIQLPPVRSSLGTLGLYQDLETGNSSRSGARDAVGSLYRRHSPNGRDQGESTGIGIQPHLPAKLPGLHKKNKEKTVTELTQTLEFLGFTVN